MANSKPDLDAVRSYLENLQDRIGEALEDEDGSVGFDRREIEREGGGRSRPRVMSDGDVVERAAVPSSSRTPSATVCLPPPPNGGPS